MAPSRGAHRLACCLFVVGALTACAVAWAPAGERARLYLAVHALLSACMLSAWWSGGTRGAAGWALAVGVVARIVLVPVAPFTTHDVERYLWDGGVALAGLDPYRVAPVDVPPEHAARLGQLPDNAAYPTLYPPGALALFAGCAALGHALAPWAWKALVCVGSLVALGLIAAELRRRGLERHLAAVALSPLLVLEGGVGAHLDLLMAPFVVASLLFAQRGRPALAGALLASAVLLKLSPIVLLPLLAVRVQVRDLAAFGAGVALPVGGAYAMAVALGLHPLGSLFAFAAEWRFGSPLFVALEGAVGARAALTLAGVGSVTMVAHAAWRSAHSSDATGWACVALAAPLLWGPVAFPWYLATLVAVAGLRPSAMVTAWSLAAPLTYEVVDRFDVDGRWEPATWPLVAIAASWSLGVGWWLVQSREPAARPQRPAANSARTTSSAGFPRGV